MKKFLPILLIAIGVLVAPGVAQGHVTYWDRSSSTSPTNNETQAQIITPFDCGAVTSIDEDPNTPDIPRIRYLDIPDNNSVVGYGASQRMFEAGWHFGGQLGAGGTSAPGDGTVTFFSMDGYPRDQQLSMRISMTIAGSANHYMKIRADNSLWLFHRWC